MSTSPLYEKIQKVLSQPHKNSMGETVMTFPTLGTLEAIKQAFIDEGWKDSVFMADRTAMGKEGQLYGHEWLARFYDQLENTKPNDDSLMPSWVGDAARRASGVDDD